MESMYNDLRDSIFALVFMATPHYGSTDHSKTLFSQACAKILQTGGNNHGKVIANGIKDNSIFSDILQDQWRCKLESYHFISCYGTLDKVS